MKKCSTCKTFRKPSFCNFIRFQIKKLLKNETYYTCPDCNMQYKEDENLATLHWITRGICIALVAYVIVWVPRDISGLKRVFIYALSAILILLANTAIYWTYARFVGVDNFKEDK